MTSCSVPNGSDSNSPIISEPGWKVRELFAVLQWAHENSILPLPCKPMSKLPDPRISTRSVYGENGPDGDSFFVLTPERKEIIKRIWEEEKLSTAYDISASVSLESLTHDGYNLVCIDVDDDRFNSLLDHPTFVACPLVRGRKGGKLLFKTVADERPKDSLFQYVELLQDGGSESLGIEVFTGKKHGLVWGQHPASTPENPIFYEFERMCDLPVLSWTEAFKVIEIYAHENGLTRKKTELGKTNPVKSAKSGADVLPESISISDKLGLRIEDLLRPVNPRNGNREIRGAHPVHGSTSGINVSVNSVKNSWYCFRHESGGGPLEWIAVEDGIIDCGDAGPGCLNGKWPALEKSLRNRGYGKDLDRIKLEKFSSKLSSTIANLNSNESSETDTGIFNCTDAGNSERLVKRCGTEIRYCHPYKAWFIWDGSVWKRDQTGAILSRATETVRSIYTEAERADDSQDRRQIANWAKSSESWISRNNMIKGAMHLCPVDPAEFDANPYHFNCRNGTFELDTGVFREHRKEDMMSKCSSVTYDPTADCPKWKDHIKLIFEGNKDLIDYFQTLCGYTLQGKNPEQILVIMHGGGKNGKSVTLDALSEILGDYSTNISASTLMASPFGRDPAAASPDIADLAGARFVVASEPKENSDLDEQLIKQFTGDRVMKARRLRENLFEFEPKGKIFLATNHEPAIKGSDEGIWRRVKMIPFNHAISEDKRILGFDEILINESSGILNWALDGFNRWKKAGKLVDPDIVNATLENYRKGQDTVTTWFRESVICAPSMGFYEPRNKVRWSYVNYCNEMGEEPVTPKKLGSSLRRLGAKDGGKVRGERTWGDIQLRE